MILVLGGTADGRKIAAAIQQEGYSVLLSTATAYGSSLVAGIPVRSGILDQDGFQGLFKQENIRLVVDASHPYAVNASRTVMASCRGSGIPYVRYERPVASLPDNPLIHRVDSFLQAAAECGALGERIFLGTGSNNLADFTAAPGLQGKTLLVRVLPNPAIINKCLDLGVRPENIIAMQGPFGSELNRALYRHYGVEVVVSKESGEEGGTGGKVLPAIELGIPVVLVERPRLDYPYVVSDWPDLKRYLNCVKSRLSGQFEPDSRTLDNSRG